MARLKGELYEVKAPMGIRVQEGVTVILTRAQYEDRKHQVRTVEEGLTKEDGHGEYVLTSETMFRNKEKVRIVGDVPANLATVLVTEDGETVAEKRDGAKDGAKPKTAAEKRAAKEAAAAEAKKKAEDDAAAEAARKAQEGGSGGGQGGGSVIDNANKS